jgi:hypothetical protein
MRFSVSAIWCAIPRLSQLEIAHQIAQQIATPYRNTISHATCKW